LKISHDTVWAAQETSIRKTHMDLLAEVERAIDASFELLSKRDMRDLPQIMDAFEVMAKASAYFQLRSTQVITSEDPEMRLFMENFTKGLNAQSERLKELIKIIEQFDEGGEKKDDNS
jgi:hypothetical protein